MPLVVHHLAPDDVPLMEALLVTFGEAFDDVDTYTGNRPSAEYLRRLLGGDSFIALAALKNGHVVGGIAAYELRKFEQERSEIYIYDLAVSAAHRREGIATRLIDELKKVAVERKADPSDRRRRRAGRGEHARVRRVELADHEVQRPPQLIGRP